jgi:hypothetical protein
MTDIPDRPLATEAAWKGPDMARDPRWIHQLDDDDLAELDAALRHVEAKGLEITDIARNDFPLPTLAVILDEIETGRGFAMIRGIPVEKYGERGSSILYWGIGAHFGRAVAQNRMGHLLGHVRSEGRDWTTDNNARGYQTTAHLPFHCDKADVVGLLCLQVAKSGGLSCIASSVAIHDALLERRPDLLRALYGTFCIDHRGEEFDGQRPYYETPMFGMHDGQLYARYGSKYVFDAQRFPEAPRLTELDREALETFRDHAASDEFRLDMEFRRGDMQFLNNRWIVHSRTDYEDWPEPERRRHLLRLLLFTIPDAERPDFTREINDLVIAWGEHPREPAEAALAEG